MSEASTYPGELTPDATATVLLCASVEGRKATAGPRPLTVPEYVALARWLHGEGMKPGSLLDAEGIRRLPDAVPDGPSRERLEALLARGLSLSVLLEKWAARGIRAVTRSDSDYPTRLADQLKGQRPPVLFVAGDLALVGRRSVAVVGSRDADESALDLTSSIGRWAAGRGVAVVSGGARGIDSAAVHSALQAGGAAVAVLADGLSRAVLAATYREALGESRLLLASPYSPDAGFSVGNAMGRNKLVYAFSDAAVVVSSAEGSGGTWAGANEALKKGWVPVFVDSRRDAPPGNGALLSKGARAFSFDELERSVGLYPLPAPPMAPGVEAGPTVIAEPTPPAPGPSPIGPVFDLVWPLLREALLQTGVAAGVARTLSVRPEQALDWLKVAESKGLARRSGRKWLPDDSANAPTEPGTPLAAPGVRTALGEIRPRLERARKLGYKPKKLAEELGVRPGQLQDWLSELDGGAAVRPKKSRRKSADQPGLFD